MPEAPANRPLTVPPAPAKAPTDKPAPGNWVSARFDATERAVGRIVGEQRRRFEAIEQRLDEFERQRALERRIDELERRLDGGNP